VRARASRDQRVPKLDLRLVRLQPMVGDETSPAAEERDAVVAFDLVLVEGDTVVDHSPDARHHRRKVDGNLAEPDPELGRDATVCCDLRGPDQGFRGDAPTRDSGAADQAALEERHPRAPGAGGANARPAAHAGADHGDVIGLPAAS
jgi:hypothetical protein